MVPQLDCRYVAFLDADDLFSDNWLAAGITALDDAAARGERAIAHPELNVVFDGARTIQVSIDQRLAAVHAALPLPAALLRLAVPGAARGPPRDPLRQPRRAERAVLPGLPLHDRDPGRRLAAPGAPDTIIFKRRRDVSLVTESTQRKAVVRTLPGMAIDRVRDLGR